MYIIDSFKHPSFKSKKIKIIFNSILYLIYSVFKIKIKYQIKLKQTSFLFNFVPLGKQSGSGGLFVYREDYEPLLNNCSKVLKRNDIVLDIGANQGIYSIAFSKLVGPKGSVIAVEPFNKMIKCLEDNIKINNLDNIKIHQKVVSDKNGIETIYFNKGTVSASINEEFSLKNKFDIESTTIDEICSKSLKIDFIKLDIEGAELKALKGAKLTLEKFKPILSLEVDENSYNKIFEYLRFYNYNSYIFSREGDLKLVSNIKNKHSNLIFKSD